MSYPIGVKTLTQPKQSASPLPPLQEVIRPNLSTAEAAFYLNRRPQTLRSWACLENGPIRPRRISGLLAWSTAEVKALAGVTSGADKMAVRELTTENLIKPPLTE